MKTNKGFMLVVVCLALTACQQAKQEAEQSAAPEPATLDRAPAQGTMKVGASIDMAYELKGTPALNEVLEIGVTFRSMGMASGELEVTFTTNNLLVVDASTARMGPEKVGGGQTISHDLRITPVSAGAGYINVFAQMSQAGGPMMRTFAIPIQVGPVVQQEKVLERDADGEPIIPLPSS